MEFLRKNSVQITLLIATFAMMYIALFSEPKSHKKPNRGIKYGKVKRINDESNREIQMKYKLTELENQASAPIDPSQQAGKEHVPNVVNMHPNSGAFDADEGHIKVAPTLDAKLESFLAEREKFEEMEGIKKREYAELFKEQARQMGYEVEINSDMEIVKVRKISDN